MVVTYTSGFSSRKWVVSIAAIAESIARFDNTTAGEAVIRLARLAPAAEALQRLVNVPVRVGTPHGEPRNMTTAEEALALWEAMAKRALRRSNQFDDLPALTQSWGLLAEDVLCLTEDAKLRESLGAELSALAIAAKPSLAENVAPTSIADARVTAAVEAVGSAPDRAEDPKHDAARRNTTGGRRDVLVPAIELAQRKSLDPWDTAQVWAQLELMAQSRHPPFVDSHSGGLVYTDGGVRSGFSLKKLRDRLKYAKRKLAATS